jgi:predicted nucleotidyltransferase
MKYLSVNEGPAGMLFGKARRAVLSLLMAHSDEAFYLRQIVRDSGQGLGPVQRELKRLVDGKIVRRTARGRQVYFQANPESPIFQEIKSLMARMQSARASKPPPQGKPLPMRQRFNIPGPTLTAFCRRNHIAKLSLFGSALRDDFRPDSDVDVLVEFEPDHVPGFAIVAMENELSRLAGRKVDLRTPRDLSRYFRDEVVAKAEAVYEER